MKQRAWVYSVVSLLLSTSLVVACTTDEDVTPADSSNQDDGGVPTAEAGGGPMQDGGSPTGQDGGDASSPEQDSGDNDAGTIGDGGNDSGDDDAGSQTTTVHVTAAAGGTVTDPSGNTTLVIPPGALAADTDITLAILPKSGAAVVGVSDFGPNGLQFSVPATLSIKADASLAPQDKTLAIGLHDGTDFQPIDGSTYAGGVATAEISHFSMFSVVVVDGEIVIQPGGECDDMMNDFTACGGNMIGTWVMKQLCVDQTPIGGNDGCPGMAGTMDIDAHDRELTFSATTMELPAGSFTITTTMDYPRSCAGNITCTQLEQSMTDWVCADKSASVCACTHVEQEPQDAETMTYTANGATVTTSEGDTMEYCVKGDVLFIKNIPTDDDDVPSLWRLDRKN